MLSSGRPQRLLPLLVATAFTFLVLDVAGFTPIVNVRRTVLSIGQPIGAVLAFVVSPLTGTWNGAVHYDDVIDENHELRRRVAELEGAIAGRPDAESELRALLAATEIDYLGDVDRVTARVAADRQTDFERIVEINKGEADGIARGMPVVTGHGLVGIVELVTGDRSVIRLITDVDVAVGVRSEHGLGLARGSRDGGLRLEVTPELAQSIRLGAAVDGERFVTSGVDRSAYPAGIPVGRLVVRSGGGASNGEFAGAGSEAGSSDPAGPTLRPGQQGYGDATLQVSLEPLAGIERLGYLTVLLIDRPA